MNSSRTGYPFSVNNNYICIFKAMYFSQLPKPTLYFLSLKGCTHKCFRYVFSLQMHLMLAAFISCIPLHVIPPSTSLKE